MVAMGRMGRMAGGSPPGLKQGERDGDDSRDQDAAASDVEEET
jgi:hypothetical protein